MSEIVTFYQQRIAEHGVGYEAMWGDSDANRWKAAERFKIVESGDVIDGDRLLDLGCGMGMLKMHLDAIGARAAYTGVDVVPEFLAHVANAHHSPTIKANFYQELDLLPNAEWLAVFGSINKKWLVGLAEEDGVEPVYDWLARCFEKAEKGLFLSCFSDRCERMKPANVHLNPLRLLERFGDALKAYRIRHDTSFYEFTLMARK